MPESAWLPIVRAKAIAMMMDEIKGDLAALNIQHDVFFSERSLIETGNDKVAETIDFLRAKGDIYEGRLPPPKGAPVEDWEDREQTLFRATAFGDDVDRPLMKSDGSYTYFASDIAYHKNKFDRGFADLIDVWGADHGGYIKRMQAAVKAVTAGKAALDVKIVQLVKLLRAGEPVKMSKRSGDFVTLREVVDEVGSDAVRFMMLYRKNDAVLDFDLAKVIEQSQGQPGVLRPVRPRPRPFDLPQRAGEVLPDLPEEAAARAAYLANAPLERLTDPAELDLLKRLALFPGRSRRRRSHMSRTESLFTCMILPANFTRSGPRGAICPIYASLSIMMQRSQRRDWRWFRASSRFWRRACRSRRPCSNRDAVGRGIGPHGWGFVRVSGRGHFVCTSGVYRDLAPSRRGCIFTMADRYQDRPFPADDDHDRGATTRRGENDRWPNWRA